MEDHTEKQPKRKLVPFDQNRQPRHLISNLAKAIKMFVPVIVNDSDAPGGTRWSGEFKPAPGIEPQDLPTFPQFINTAAGAIQEVHEFIKTHEALKRILIDTQKAFAEIETIVLGPKEDGDPLQPASTITEISRIYTEWKQMKDILEAAAATDPASALQIVQKYYFKNGIIPTIVKKVESIEGQATGSAPQGAN